MTARRLLPVHIVVHVRYYVLLSLTSDLMRWMISLMSLLSVLLWLLNWTVSTTMHPGGPLKGTN
jgi:hypothetical protein